MAYLFTSASSQYLTTSSTPVSGVPLTMSAWVKPTTLTANAVVVSIGNTVLIPGSANSRFQMNLSLSGTVVANATSPTSSTNSQTTTTTSAGVWAHCLAVFSSNSSRTAYLNGIAGNTDTATYATSGVQNIAIGARFNNGWGNYTNSTIADVGVWSIALAQDDIRALASGISPLHVRPESLVFYAPLIRELIDFRSGYTFVNINGAIVANHPRIYL